MEQGMKMPYVKPSLETIDVKSLTEAVGPVQAFSSGSSEPAAVGPQRLTATGKNTLKRH